MSRPMSKISLPNAGTTSPPVPEPTDGSSEQASTTPPLPARPLSVASPPTAGTMGTPPPSAPVRSKKLANLIGNYEKTAAAPYERVQVGPPGPSTPTAAQPPPSSPSLPSSSSSQPIQPKPSEVPSSPALSQRPVLAPSKSLQQPTDVPSHPAPPATGGGDSGTDGADFGSCLQSARDCINKRHEEELKALESFRMYVHKRARADAEYAATLGKINSLTAREMAGIGPTSVIVQAWNAVLEAMDCVQKKLQVCSKQVEETLLHKVDQLIKDKRGAKRAYDIGRSQLDDEYRRSCSEVQNLRRDYLLALQGTGAAKKKLEQMMSKQGAKPAEVEKLRAKFVSSAEKLHKCHNDYTLAILNANTHMNHHHKSTVPFCLNTLQERMELIVSQWRGGMEEYGHTMDMSQVYQESFGKLFTTLQNINPSEEYANLIQENKSGSDEDDFTFDTSLLQDYCSPKVEATKMSINNLTHDNLKAELTKMEQRLEEYERQHTEKTEKLKALGDDNTTTTTAAVQNPEVPKAVLISNLQAELKQLDCTIEREKAKVERVKQDLGEVGENTPLFDPLGEGVVTAAEPTSPTLPPEATSPSASSDAAENAEGDKKASEKGGKSKQAKLSTLKKGFAKGFSKLRERMQSHPSMNQSTDTPGGETGKSGEVAGGGGDSAGGGDAAEVTSKGGEDNESETSSTYEVPPETRVEDERWFYANMERKEADDKCKNTGDYLVRYSSKQNRYVLTVNWAGQGKHFVIQESSDEQGKTKYRLESKGFPSVRELLDFHVSTQTPVTKASCAILSRPVLREEDKWALRHEDIKMGKKLGKGAFGDVWEATLKGQTKVAVKTCRSTDVPDREKFLQEAEILKQYDHPNIVKLIGVSWDTEPVLIVMELMPGGSLLDYLRKKAGSMPKGKMLHMSIDACSGMEYLESKNCIHRDLAARNCLVGDSDVVKISDFGMSREEEGGMYTVQSGTRQIPIKWTAPEALNYGRYTSASDVWSFGVLLYEVFSNGSVPYPGMSNAETRTQVDNGYRMPPPQGCPKEVHGVMQQCWAYEADDRPKFGAILESLKKLEGTIQ